MVHALCIGQTKHLSDHRFPSGLLSPSSIISGGGFKRRAFSHLRMKSTGRDSISIDGLPVHQRKNLQETINSIQNCILLDKAIHALFDGYDVSN